MLKILKSFAKATKSCVKHDGVEHSGYISFLLVLSIFPFLFLVISMASMISNEKIYSAIINLLSQSLDVDYIDALRPTILNIISKPPQGLLTIIVASSLWTSSSIFEAARTILNKAYRIEKTPSYFIRKLVSMLECTVFIFVIFTFALTVLFNKYFEFVNNIMNFNIGPVYNYISTFLIVSAIYHFLPNHRENKILQAMPGALFVTIIWSIFTKIFAYYISVSVIHVVYGGLAGIVISLLYFYICSIIFVIGAEFNYHIKSKR